MEELFATLSSPVRLWVVQFLASHGPTRQVDLAREFARSELSSGPDVNEGAMSNAVRPLINAGLITKDRARGPLRLAYEDQTRRLLSMASALMVAITSDAHSIADSRHQGLMRGITRPIADQPAAADAQPADT